ncbi:MAG TPA: MgtC/SapB family protein [Candidatus Paceibacterota bacterium]|nr:MgtC/SapB family protein [Candidatus Paceibacterota bacterium]
MMQAVPSPINWVPLDVLGRLLLALGIGLLVGLEREWRGKEAGLRTFGLVSVLGALGGLLGTGYAIASIAPVGILLVFLNLQGMRTDKSTELTTSAALVVIFFTGILCGLGHRVTPVAVSVVTAGLLSWKESLSEFGHRLTAAELRSAILLGILAFAVYPVLPNHPIDPWGLIAPRAAWLTVLLIAGIGFGNYILWKLFGTRGIEFAGFLGGLVNSTVTVNELSSRVAEVGSGLIDVAYRGIMLSVAAMALRNALVLGLLRPSALAVSGTSLGLMLVTSGVQALSTSKAAAPIGEGEPLDLKSPFSLFSALKFGAIFLLLQIAGTGAQRLFGHFGFYAVSIVGGFVSSASAVAAAATLAAGGKIAPTVAGVGAVLASLASASVNIFLVARLARSPELSRRVRFSTIVVLAIGLAGAIATAYLA